MSKKYRIVYWFCSMTTDTTIKADSEESAIKEFVARKGNLRIISVTEVKKGAN